MRVVVIYILVSVWLLALPKPIVDIIAKSGIAKKDISIYIKEVGIDGRVIASHNAQTTRTPASVIKVLTTYAAVLKLGFDYRFPTRFYSTGSLRDGVLHGDLVIKGFGDPTLGSKDLKKIVANIRAKGISKITGHIVIDRSYFRVGTKDSSNFDENPYSPYNAMPDAMMFNERISTICVTPNKNSVTKKHADGSYRVINKLQHVNKPCKGKYSWPGIKIDKSKATPSVELRGQISKSCGQRNVCKVLTKPYKSFYYALKDALNKDGIKVVGNMRLRKVSQHARLLFTHYSKSLEKIVSKTAKKSNNLYARHLLLTLGAKMYGAPASIVKGRKAIVSILKNKNALSKGTLSIDNGSGLSRTAKMSAKILVDMYDNAYKHYGQRWMNTLSVAGIDGTIKKRFRSTQVKNRAWMKTGTLRRVKNIGGYVKSKQGQLYTAVVLVQTNQGNWRASALQNKILKWLVSYKSRGKVENVQMQAAEYISSSAGKKYYVQVGFFASQPTKKYLLKIESLGLRYKVKHADNYKVLVGAYGVEKDAKKALVTVRKHINKGAFIVRL